MLEMLLGIYPPIQRSVMYINAMSENHAMLKANAVYHCLSPSNPCPNLTECTR
jgi:hypothetical protein